MPLLEVMTWWRKTTRPDLCKRVLPKFLEFVLNLVKIGNLAALTKCWGKIACSCAMNYFPSLLKQVISSQAQQNKHWMMWLSAETYVVWGGCRTRDAKNIWPNSICCMPQWPYLLDSFGHLGVGCVWRLGQTLHPPKGCANALNYASHLLLNGWVDAGLTNIAWECLTYFIAKVRPLMFPK